MFQPKQTSLVYLYENINSKLDSCRDQAIEYDVVDFFIGKSTLWGRAHNVREASLKFFSIT